MASKNSKNKTGKQYADSQSRRINRRLPKDMQQEGLTNEAARTQEAANTETDLTHAAKDEKPGFFSRFATRKESTAKPRYRWLKISLISMAALMVTGFLVLWVFLAQATKNDYLWLDLGQIPHKTETIIYSADPVTGQQEVYTSLPSTQNKVYVEGDKIPQHLKDAFVAVEDKDFYKHRGVSFKRTVFAALNEVKHMLTGSYIGGEEGRKQGASTITQQLIKNLTLDDENSKVAGYLRKLREIYRALKLDSKYSKDEILVAYLNVISFTGNTAGVQAEAEKLFGVGVEDLTIAQSASIAAITRNPSRYNPVKNPEYHLERRNYVLNEMHNQGYITAQQLQQALAEPVELAGNEEPKRDEVVTSYFTDAVMESVVTDLQDEFNLSRRESTHLLYNGGLRIYATVNKQLQDVMEDTLKNASMYPRPAVKIKGPLTDEEGQPVLDDKEKPVIGDIQVKPQGAMVSLTYDGGVAAVVGGLGEKTISRGFNRGTSAVRQVGSTMKPIGPYAVALENNNIHWSSAFLDSPVGKEEDENSGELVDWPKNVDNRYTNKDILVREGMARSVNTIAVRVGEAAGIKNIYNFVRDDLSISTITKEDDKPGPMVLGSSTTGITPIEMAKAYAMFGNGGYAPEIHYYTLITNGQGTKVLEEKPAQHQAISSDTAYVMNRLLKEVMKPGGTASGMSVNDGMDSVGKTGTTSDYRDHWFIGMTPYYVTASWYGYDENLRLSVNSRNHPPTAAWRTVMQKGQKGLPAKEFPADPTVVEQTYCTASGYIAGPSCPSAVGYYRITNLPEDGCPLHSA